MAGTQHFHVLAGLCGLYMPDENYVYRTRGEAEQGARELAQQFRDDGERVSGSAKGGYFKIGKDYCVEVTDCDQVECLSDLEPSGE